MLQLSQQQIKKFQQKILSWYSENKRNLPWRHTRDPYRILISEVMSQQTQISRVIPKYEAWITELPTVEILTSASTDDVLRLWSGLGYNRRALYLQKTAQKPVKGIGLRGKGKVIWPEIEEELIQLPGIGQYTARAILCFAFNKQIAVVDTNVRRVILTQFQISNFKCQISNKELQQVADQLLPYGRAYEWNQALMDYAAAVLKKEKIPIPKQSKYKDSDRYYRGQIVKLLLQQQQISQAVLHDHFNKDEERITKVRLEKVIAGLEKDKMIEKNKQKLRLA